MTISPCISICKTDPVTGYCYGCGRSNDDKKKWKTDTTTNDWKQKNIIEIQKRLMKSLSCHFLPDTSVKILNCSLTTLVI